jgi:hypothetical protein
MALPGPRTLDRYGREYKRRSFALSLCKATFTSASAACKQCHNDDFDDAQANGESAALWE